MHTFFVDISEGDRFVRDCEGQVFAEPVTPEQGALAALAQLLSDDPRLGSSRTVVATVRDASDREVFKATLQLRGEPLRSH